MSINVQHREQLNKLLNHYSLPMRAAELGTAEGRFAKQMYDWGLDFLYLVDLFEKVPFIDGCASFEQQWHDKNYESVLKLFGSDKKVSILKGMSHKMSEQVQNESLGLVYVDSDHSYMGCKAEIQYWWDKIVPGGIMAFHDYANLDYGVNRAVIEFVKGEHNVNRIEEDGQTENIGAWIRK